MPQTQPITEANLEAAESLLGITHTVAERALMLENIAGQIAQAQARRALPLPASLGPATKFDPRLPGFTPPAEAPFSWTPPETKLPADAADIAFAPLTQLAGWIFHRQLSAQALTQLYLDRIAELNPKLLCFARLAPEAALARAAALDTLLAAGTWLGPLHGIPYGMKDIIDTAGIETDFGAEPYIGRIPAEDAHVTTLLHAAGAILLGKTTVGALAYGDIWHGGRTRNPWNTAEGSSGSSAGSAAAVAAGLAGFAIGTETLGSIVSPSTRCGVAGLRPTHGRVSRRGAMPLCWSLDKIGPICRAVGDTALVLNVLNAPDPQDAFQIPMPFTNAAPPLAGLRLGYFEADFADPDAHALDHAALAAADALGLQRVPLQRSALPYDSLLAILHAEAAAAFEELTLSGQDDLLTWQEADAWPNSFRKARFLSAVDHIQADRLRRLVMQEMDETFRSVDLILGPSLIGPMLVQTNFTGHPCLCLPTGLRRAPARTPLALSRNFPADAPAGPEFDVPHSICIWAPLFNEAPMLALGQALESHFAMASRRPPI